MTKPIDLELEHYHKTVETGTWRGGAPYLAAIQEAHATFIGFHGYPREWLAENPKVAREFANRAGYWYFPKSMEAPETAERGSTVSFKLVWENHGAAPAYHKYDLKVMLDSTSGDARYTQELKESDNRKWMPGRIIGEPYMLDIPADLTPGAYQIKIALMDESRGNPRLVELGLTDQVRGQDGFYHIAEIVVV